MATKNDTQTANTPADLFNNMATAQLDYLGFLQQEMTRMNKLGQDLANSNIEVATKATQNTMNAHNAMVAEWNKLGQETLKRMNEAMTPKA